MAALARNRSRASGVIGGWLLQVGAETMEYRFYFLGPDCRIFARREFHAESDNAALELAWAMFNTDTTPHHGFELWESGRRIYTHNC
jgi:hypothetical protein